MTSNSTTVTLTGDPADIELIRTLARRLGVIVLDEPVSQPTTVAASSTTDLQVVPPPFPPPPNVVPSPSLAASTLPLEDCPYCRYRFREENVPVGQSFMTYLSNFRARLCIPYDLTMLCPEPVATTLGFSCTSPYGCEMSPTVRCTSKKQARETYIINSFRGHSQHPAFAPELAAEWAWIINGTSLSLPPVPLSISYLVTPINLPNPRTNISPHRGFLSNISCGPYALLRTIAASRIHTTIQSCVDDCLPMLQTVLKVYNESCQLGAFDQPLTLSSGITVAAMSLLHDLLVKAGIYFNVGVLSIRMNPMAVGAAPGHLMLTPMRAHPGCTVWVMYVPAVQLELPHWELMCLRTDDVTTDAIPLVVGPAPFLGIMSYSAMATNNQDQQRQVILSTALFDVNVAQFALLGVPNLANIGVVGWDYAMLVPAICVAPRWLDLVPGLLHFQRQNLELDCDAAAAAIQNEEDLFFMAITFNQQMAHALLAPGEAARLDAIKLAKVQDIYRSLDMTFIPDYTMPHDELFHGYYEAVLALMWEDFEVEYQNMYKKFVVNIATLHSEAYDTSLPSYGHLLGPRAEPYVYIEAFDAFYGNYLQLYYYDFEVEAYRWLPVGPRPNDLFDGPVVEDDARLRMPPLLPPVHAYFAGAHPPPFKGLHWCGLGCAAASDPQICGALEQCGLSVCNCILAFRGRCRHYWAKAFWRWWNGEAPMELYATSVSKEAHAFNYIIPIRRVGWTPFAQPCGDKDVSFGLQRGNVRTPVPTITSHRIVTSDGPFPAMSEHHRLVGHRTHYVDPLASVVGDNGELVGSAVECLSYVYEPRWANQNRRSLLLPGLIFAILATIAIAMTQLGLHIAASNLGRIGEWTPSCWSLDWRLDLDPMHGQGWVQDLDRFAVLWLSRLSIFLVALINWLLWATCHILSLTFNTTNYIFHYQSAFGALLWSICRAMQVLYFLVWGFYLYHAVRDLLFSTLISVPWVRQQPRWMLPYIKRSLLIPEAEKHVAAAIATWDGQSPFKQVLQSKLVRELFLKGWSSPEVTEPGEHTGFVEPDLLESIARMIQNAPVTTRAAFRVGTPYVGRDGLQVPGAARVHRILKTCDTLPSRKPSQKMECHRPGCTNIIPKKARHHLCASCSTSLKNQTLRSWLWSLGQAIPGPCDGYLMIPETELPLPKMDMDINPHPGKDWNIRTYTGDEELKLLHCYDEAAVPAPAGFLAGFGLSLCQPMCSLKTYICNVRAIVARIFRRNPLTPDPGYWAQLERLATTTPELLATDTKVEIQPMTFDEWVRGFVPSRQKVLRAAEAAWRASGHCWEAVSWCTTRAFQLFVKREWLPRSEPDSECLMMLKLSYKPRAIQPPEEVCHLVLGPALRAVTHWLKDVWNHHSPIFYASSTPEKLDAWLQHLIENYDNYTWCDYTMFDCTHSRHTWRFLEDFYKRVIPPEWEHYEMFLAVLEHLRAPWGNTVGKRSSMHKVRAKYKGRIMNASGRDDTALANALLNGLVMSISLAAAWFRVDVASLTPDMMSGFFRVSKISIVGDDSIAGIPGTYADGCPLDEAFYSTVERHIQTFGFLPKFGHSTRWQDIVYLGCRAYKVAGRYHWGPTLGRRLYKHHACLHPEYNPTAWLNGVAEMELLCYNHVPIIRTMAAVVRKLQSNLKVTPYKWDPHQVVWERKAKLPPPDYNTYVHLAESYSNERVTTTVEMLFDLEDVILKTDSLPVLLDHPTITNFLLVDDL